MGRGKRQTGRSAGDDALASALSEQEQKLLQAIPRGGMDARGLRVPDLKPQQKSRLLAGLERKGLVERYPNGHGPEQPWWWTRLPLPEEGFESTVEIVRGKIFDRSESNGRPVVYIELMGDVNEFGCARAILKAGDNNSRETWVPPHLLERYGYWYARRRGEVTAWSAQFSCPIHGECSDDMVRTDKTCAMCGSLLNRH
jgi:hypothetical protein